MSDRAWRAAAARRRLQDEHNADQALEQAVAVYGPVGAVNRLIELLTEATTKPATFAPLYDPDDPPF